MARRRPITRPRHVSLISYFWSLVDKRGPDECWPWKGGSWQGEPGKSYGFFPFALRNRELAHRFSLEIAVGPIGYKLALHKCDNPPCVNPFHLYPGTSRQNARDRKERGRIPDHFEVYGRYVNQPLVEFMEARGLGVKSLSKLLGIGHGTAINWLYGRRSRVSPALRASIAPVLGDELMARAFDAQLVEDRRIKIIPEIEAAIVEGRKSKLSARRLAKDFGVAYATVFRVLKRNGLVKANPVLSIKKREWHRRRKGTAWNECQPSTPPTPRPVKG